MTAFEPIIPTEIPAGQVEFTNSLSSALLPVCFSTDNNTYQLTLALAAQLPENSKTIELQLGANQLNAAIDLSQLLHWLSGTAQ